VPLNPLPHFITSKLSTAVRLLTYFRTSTERIPFISLVTVAGSQVVQNRTSGLVTTKAGARVDAHVPHACSVGCTILVEDTLRAATRILQRGNSFYSKKKKIQMDINRILPKYLQGLQNIPADKNRSRLHCALGILRLPHKVMGSRGWVVVVLAPHGLLHILKEIKMKLVKKKC